MEKRFSKKRESIINCLKETEIHPSAEWVYEKLKPEYPDLSLATVYRNLNELAKEGKILSLGSVGDKQRFDGKTVPHAHAVCYKCGKIIDVDGVSFPKGETVSVQKITGFEIAYSNMQFVGLCKDCKKSANGLEKKDKDEQ